jgi:hypothetical protein
MNELRSFGAHLRAGAYNEIERAQLFLLFFHKREVILYFIVQEEKRRNKERKIKADKIRKGKAFSDFCKKS